MGISRSGYYKWILRKGKLNCYKSNRKLLSEYIIDVHNKHKSWGYRKISAKIRGNTGLYFSDNLCHKCCKHLNIKAKGRKTWIVKGDESIIYPNRIWNNWKQKRPFEVIVTDTTIFKNKGLSWDWTIYIDTFNNEIVGYDLDKSKHVSGFPNHMRALKMMLQNKIKRGYKNLETILHSDQGVIYSSAAFANAYKNYNIIQSMSRKGTPTDNPLMESLNGWIKEELYIDFNLYNSVDVKETIKNYVEYFNKERSSSKLRYRSPIQYRTELNLK